MGAHELGHPAVPPFQRSVCLPKMKLTPVTFPGPFLDAPLGNHGIPRARMGVKGIVPGRAGVPREFVVAVQGISGRGAFGVVG